MFGCRPAAKLIGLCLSLLGAVVLGLLSCTSHQPDTQPSVQANITITAVEFNAGEQPAPIDGPLTISAGKNEWVAFILQIQHGPGAQSAIQQLLQFRPMKAKGTAEVISSESFSVYQVLPLPVECRGADYVRQTGLPTGSRELPRALLPVAMKNGAIDLSALRNPDDPANPSGRPTKPSAAPLLLWIDLHVPARLAAGDYAGSCDLLAAGDAKVQTKVPIALHVYDFVIPDARHLLMYSELPWDQLTRLYGEEFQGITPRLVNRSDKHNAGAVQTMDDLVCLAHEHRVQVVIPRLQPTVKWPPQQPPEIDWSDFDSLVGPWLSGQAFADKNSLEPWPPPAVDHLGDHDAAGQKAYTSAATAHFQQNKWLRPAARPAWYTGAAGNETDVRLNAWQEMTADNVELSFPSPLPNSLKPGEPADAADLVWFYPGAWFGVAGSVPSVQLKWLRRAQQDYEYFYLATQHHMGGSARQIARSITKSVALQPGHEADPIYTLFRGDVDHHDWRQAVDLLARGITADPGDKHFNLDLLRWLEPRQTHLILPRATQWSWDADAAQGQHWANLNLGVDVYNGGDDRHDAEVRCQPAGPEWSLPPAPINVGNVPAYGVQRSVLPARINLDKLSPDSRQPLQLLYVDTYTQKQYPAAVCLPVAVSYRREPLPKLRDDLSDWTADDLLHDGKLIEFFSRPAIQQGKLESAQTAAQVYSGWTDQDLYVAFKLNGITSGGDGHHSNTPDYDLGRAWGQDLCEVLMQAIYADNTTGPVLHVICKPGGAVCVETKPASGADRQWESLQGAALRYACDAEKTVWTGELVIGWKSLSPGTHPPVKLLRFNFSQHRSATGESASWAGPVDSGRDDACTGLIYLRDAAVPGMHEKSEAR